MQVSSGSTAPAQLTIDGYHILDVRDLLGFVDGSENRSGRRPVRRS